MVSNRPPKTHKIKCENPYFSKIASGIRTCEVRIYDRDFLSGDNLVLQEYNKATDTYSGRELTVIITDVTTSVDFEGVKIGWCVLSLGGLRWSVSETDV